ncbi:hypothetical protein [Fluviicola sp.]|uniref:hypothetical protein n=1 Tax=Fluviicola sp. TaxID=1917219 RepID=UPI003D26AD56
MKNLALIIIAVIGTSVASYAQDGKKQEPTKKIETKKPTKRIVKSLDKKKEIPAEKTK